MAMSRDELGLRSETVRRTNLSVILQPNTQYAYAMWRNSSGSTTSSRPARAAAPAR